MTAQTEQEKTFRDYKPSEAQAYAAARGARATYPPALYDTILKHHADTGGSFNCLLDVGCGPGNATRDLAPNFDKGFGTDPSKEMIATAQKEGGDAIGRPITFEVADAEDCDRVQGLDEGTVDLLTAAMAAHWFDMPRFWRAAARVVRSGGTVALWTCASLYCHPEVPNFEEIQRILFKFEREKLEPYHTPGLRISRSGYTTLPLPWQIEPVVTQFNVESFSRHDWNKDGLVEPGKHFLRGDKEEELDDFAKGVNTASMVTRWRQANPKLAHTDQDCVKVMIEDLKKVIGENGKLRTGSWTALLLVKKK